MQCERCKINIIPSDSYYYCNCAKVPRVIAKRSLSLAEAAVLISTGKTKTLTGFVSRAGNEFSAHLVLSEGNVEFGFSNSRSVHQANQQEAVVKPRQEPEQQRSRLEEVFIRIESFRSGTAAFYISGPLKKSAEMSFGLVPSRAAECLALIAAIGCVEHNGGIGKLAAKASLNNLDFSRYLLRERTPRDQETKKMVECAVGLLSKFASWSAEFKPQQRPKLRGGTANNDFPRGVFPWLQVQINDLGSESEVWLPPNPAVIANFKASIRAASGEGEVYRVPSSILKVVQAWIASVSGQSSSEQKAVLG